jgi:hypothetical protein
MSLCLAVFCSSSKLPLKKKEKTNSISVTLFLSLAFAFFYSDEKNYYLRLQNQRLWEDMAGDRGHPAASRRRPTVKDDGTHP